MPRQKSTWLEWVFGLGRSLFLLLIVIGAYAAAFGQRAGAYLMLAGLLGSIATHLLVGVVGYRQVMRRDWPNVAPLDDWDD